ncbi:hypothetical protein JTB14_030949 [Gonioctena quinquepunctata]|nr:hypothetical protein JTB14_030949 [Gonioctena quinquepunctata]
MIKLASSDFASLLSNCNLKSLKRADDVRNKWLTDYCLDGIAFTWLDNFRDIYYIDTISTQILMQGVNTLSNFAPFLMPMKECNYILLPVNSRGNHWLLVIVDVKHHVMHILDPGYAHEEEHICVKINTFFQNRTESLESEWKVQPNPFNIPKQSDSHNCGVYYFITSIYFPRLGQSLRSGIISKINRTLIERFG